jgi:molybdopterin synthase catalytic subunit
MDRKPKTIFVEGPITAEKIASSIQNHASKHDIGAHSIFLGQVRADHLDAGLVTAIEYSCYQDLALEKAFEIREDVIGKYDLTCMHVYHSLGLVNVGEICLFVFTSSKHRKAAIEACNELVERIKAELPIWGKEIFQDNSTQWKENKPL